MPPHRTESNPHTAIHRPHSTHNHQHPPRAVTLRLQRARPQNRMQPRLNPARRQRGTLDTLSHLRRGLSSPRLLPSPRFGRVSPFAGRPLALGGCRSGCSHPSCFLPYPFDSQRVRRRYCECFCCLRLCASGGRPPHFGGRCGDLRGLAFNHQRSCGPPGRRSRINVAFAGDCGFCCSGHTGRCRTGHHWTGRCQIRRNRLRCYWPGCDEPGCCGAGYCLSRIRRHCLCRVHIHAHRFSRRRNQLRRRLEIVKIDGCSQPGLSRAFLDRLRC